MKIINFLRARFRKWLNEEYWLEDYIKVGMKIGKNCDINPGLVVDYSHCWLIEIGNNVTIAPQVYLLAHDASTKRFLDYTKIGKVVINDYAFVGARAIIMPGVTIGKNAIVAAGSVVTKSAPEDAVVGGNPAKIITTTSELMEKHSFLMNKSKVYDSSFTLKNISESQKKQMIEDLNKEMGYVE